MTYRATLKPPDLYVDSTQRIDIDLVWESAADVFLGTMFVPKELAPAIYDDLKERLK